MYPTQHAAARAVAGGDRLVVIVGPAGTGKTSTLTAAVVDLEGRGRVVFGAAPSNQAAHVLATETGMLADSVAKLLYKHTPARTGGPGRCGRSRPGRRWSWTRPACWPPVTSPGSPSSSTGTGGGSCSGGDPYQLPAVGRGGMFAELLHHTDPVELAVVRRFTAE